MCGIAGIIADHRLTQDDHDVMSNMLDTLAHRGPDGVNRYNDDRAILGHTRLAIIDLDTGIQPIRNENGSLHIVANAEIYNHRQLRSQLESRGHRFRTNSDCETILHLYEDHGPNCVTKLQGMFAFAIYNSDTRELFLARDPLGIKPLYYTRTRSHWLFASQLDAILQHPSVPRDIDLESIHLFLTYHYVPSPRTIIKNINKIPPATTIHIKNNHTTTTNYWDVNFTANNTRTDQDWLETGRQTLHDAVHAHLESDVPVGAFLSGGLDSSAVTHAMSRIQREPVMTHTVGFNQEQFDERNDARKLAATLRTDHRDQCVRPQPLEITDIIANAFDEPFADPSAIPTFYASHLARRRVKTVLSGDGGDETLAGYSRYLQLHRQSGIRRPLSAPRIRRLLNACAKPFSPRLRAITDNLTADTDLAHYLNVAWYHPNDTLRLFNDDTTAQLAHHDPFPVIKNALANCNTTDPIARCQYADIKTWLADGVLCKVDRASMANSLEVRVPLLDTRWVQFTAALPNHLKFQNNHGKHLLRTMMQPILGDQVTNRPKKGFEVPLGHWFKGPLHDLAADLILAPNAKITEWLDHDEINRNWTCLQNRDTRLGPRFWALLMLELWTKRTLKSATPPQLVATA